MSKNQWRTSFNIKSSYSHNLVELSQQQGDFRTSEWFPSERVFFASMFTVSGLTFKYEQQFRTNPSGLLTLCFLHYDASYFY